MQQSKEVIISFIEFGLIHKFILLPSSSQIQELMIFISSIIKQRIRKKNIKPHLNVDTSKISVALQNAQVCDATVDDKQATYFFLIS